MSDEYQNCLLRKDADAAVNKPTRELCYALIDTEEDMEIVNVYSPGTFWNKAIEGARHFECGYGVVICDVKYQILPLYKIYKPLEELSTGTFTAQQQAKKKEINISEFKDIIVTKIAKRKFVSHNTTNFLGIKVNDEISMVFPRGTPVEQISSISIMFKGDIVMVKAKAEYTITGLAKIEKTYEQLRTNN